MSLEKITTQQMDAKGVCAAPDILNGTPAENKAIFDRMVRQLVAPAYNACVDLVNNMETSEETRKEAEALRVSAENLRAEAETARDNAESGRVTAEQARAEAEQLRASAEQLRADAEALRVKAEQERAANETARKQAESGRTAAEEGRVTAESQRTSAENARQAAETARANAEQTRVSNESSRQSAETARAAAESRRASEETTRQSQEAARQMAENARNVWEDYDDAKAYVPGNKVYWQGGSYVCLKTCTGVTPANSDYWQLVARSGFAEPGTFCFDVVNGRLICYYQGDDPPPFRLGEDGHLYADLEKTIDLGNVCGETAVDATLTKAGKAADAAAVGDALSTLSEDKEDKSVTRLIRDILKKAVFTEDVEELIAQLDASLTEAGVIQSGSVLSIKFGVNVAQNGNTLTIT